LCALLLRLNRVTPDAAAASSLRTTIQFGVGLLFLSMSLTIYIASRGYVVVLAPLGSSLMATYKDSATPVALRCQRLPMQMACAVQKVEFDQITEISVERSDSTAPARVLSGARLRQLEQRGMGEALDVGLGQ
jgi:hypothetical protein